MASRRPRITTPQRVVGVGASAGGLDALKYTPRPGLIGIRLEVADHHARISVIDAGPGMTGSEAGYVFDKYRRAASGAAHEGSGLGLYVSKQIVEAHGGAIGVSSVEGVGSCFAIELPRV